MKVVMYILSFVLAGTVTAQVMEEGLETKNMLGHASYEHYSPEERENYSLDGVNVGVQQRHKFENTRATMIMGPNISFLTKEKANLEEDALFLKWNHGFSYDIDMGGTMLLQPLAEAGLGYGWLNSDRLGPSDNRDENAPLVELMAGLNFKPERDINIFAKGGYRYFEVDDSGFADGGELQGTIAMLGLGVGF